MPDVRTFRAATMREALDAVRADLGSDAVILATRQVPVRRLLPWRHREEVEIVAGVGISTRAAVQRSAPKKRNIQAAHTSRPPVAEMTEPESRAAAIVRELQKRAGDGPFSAVSNEIGTASHGRREVAVPRPHVELSPPRPLAPAPTLHGTAGRGDAGPVAGPVVGPAADLTKRLDAIERMLADLGRRHRAAAEVPDDVLGVYDRLTAAEVDEPIAREIAEELQRQSTPAQLADPAAVRLRLTKLVEDRLVCGGPIATTPGVRRVVALVGPTGVGKTTTLAKLAANFRLRDGLRTGLVTVDTYRIAAVDQLRTYAEIIDLPMRVVTTPADMRAALDDLAGLDLVLIDTAGRSPRDAEQIAELRDLLEAARPDEVHLVLSLTASRKALAAAADLFRPVAPTAALVTKLDEAGAAGGLLALGREAGLPISYLTTGQDVPDDIEPARPDRLAKWITSGTGPGGSRVQGPGARGSTAPP